MMHGQNHIKFVERGR